jgi:hypothetical protein
VRTSETDGIDAGDIAGGVGGVNAVGIGDIFGGVDMAAVDEVEENWSLVFLKISFFARDG